MPYQGRLNSVLQPSVDDNGICFSEVVGKNGNGFSDLLNMDLVELKSKRPIRASNPPLARDSLILEHREHLSFELQ